MYPEQRLIRILELDEHDLHLMHRGAAASEAPGFKEVIVQHYDEEDGGDDEVDVDMVVRDVAISRLDGGDVDL